MARALVAATFINAELPKSAPSGVPIMTAYSPWRGLMPARMAEAMASGMLATPVVRPAIRSGTKLPRERGASRVRIHGHFSFLPYTSDSVRRFRGQTFRVSQTLKVFSVIAMRRACSGSTR